MRDDKLIEAMARAIAHELNKDDLPSGGWAEICRSAARGALSALTAGGYVGDGWVKCSERLPEAEKGFGESDYVLASVPFQPPFVGWFNARTKTWHVAHHFATSEPVPGVTRWRPLPAAPQPEEAP